MGIRSSLGIGGEPNFSDYSGLQVEERLLPSRPQQQINSENQYKSSKELREIGKYVDAGDYANAIRYTAVHGEELERLGLDKDKIIENIKKAEKGSEKKAQIDKYLKAGDYANAMRYTAVYGEELEELGLDKDKIIENIKRAEKGSEKKAQIDKYLKSGDYENAIRYIEDHKDELVAAGMKADYLDELIGNFSKAIEAKKIYDEVITLANAGKKDEAIKLIENNKETLKALVKNISGLIAQIKKGGGVNFAGFPLDRAIAVIQSTATESILATSVPVNTKKDPSLVDDTKLVVFYGLKQDKSNDETLKTSILAFENNNGRYNVASSVYSGAQVKEGLVQQKASASDSVKELQEALGFSVEAQTGVMDETTLIMLSNFKAAHPEYFPNDADNLKGIKIKGDYATNKYAEQIRKGYVDEDRLDEQIEACDLAWKISNGTVFQGADALKGAGRRDILRVASALVQVPGHDGRSITKPSKDLVEKVTAEIAAKRKSLQKAAGLSDAQLKPITEKLQFFCVTAIAVQSGSRTKEQAHKEVAEYFKKVSAKGGSVPNFDAFAPSQFREGNDSRNIAALGLEFRKMLNTHELKILQRNSKIDEQFNKEASKILKKHNLKSGDLNTEGTNPAKQKFSSLINAVEAVSGSNLSDSEIALAQKLAAADVHKGVLAKALFIAYAGTKGDDEDDNDKKDTATINKEIRESYNDLSMAKAFQTEAKKQDSKIESQTSIEINETLLKNIRYERDNSGAKTLVVPAINEKKIITNKETHGVDDLMREAPLSSIILSLIQTGYRGELSGARKSKEKAHLSKKTLYEIPAEALYGQDIDAVIKVFYGKTYMVSFNLSDPNEINALKDLPFIKDLPNPELNVLKKLSAICFSGTNALLTQDEVSLIYKMVNSKDSKIDGSGRAVLLKLLKKGPNSKFIYLKPMKEGAGNNEKREIEALRALASDLKRSNGYINSLNENSPFLKAKTSEKQQFASAALSDADSLSKSDHSLAFQALRRISWQLGLTYIPSEDPKSKEKGALERGLHSIEAGVAESNIKSENMIMQSGVDEQLVAYLKLQYKTVNVNGRKITYSQRVKELSDAMDARRKTINELVSQAENIKEIKDKLSKYSDQSQKSEVLQKFLCDTGNPKYSELKAKLLKAVTEYDSLNRQAVDLYIDIHNGRIDAGLWGVLRKKEGIIRQGAGTKFYDSIRYLLGETVLDHIKDKDYKLVQDDLVAMAERAILSSGGDISTKVAVGEPEDISKGKIALQILLNNLGVAVPKNETDLALLGASFGPYFGPAGLAGSGILGVASLVNPQMKDPGSSPSGAIENGQSWLGIFRIFNRNLNAGDIPNTPIGPVLKMLIQEEKPVQALAATQKHSQEGTQPGNYLINKKSILKFIELLKKTRAQIIANGLADDVAKLEKYGDKGIKLKFDKWDEFISKVESYTATLGNGSHIELWSPSEYRKDTPLNVLSQLVLDYMNIQEVLYKGIAGIQEDMSNYPFTQFDPRSVAHIDGKKVTVEHYVDRSSDNLAAALYRADAKIPHSELSPLPPAANYSRDPIGLLRRGLVDSWGNYDWTTENIFNDTVKNAGQTAFNWGLWVPLTINYNFAKSIFTNWNELPRTASSFLMWELGVTPARMIIDQLDKGNPLLSMSTLAVSAPILYGSLLTSQRTFGIYLGPGWEAVNLYKFGKGLVNAAGARDASLIFRPFAEDFRKGYLGRVINGTVPVERHGMVSGAIADVLGNGIKGFNHVRHNGISNSFETAVNRVKGQNPNKIIEFAILEKSSNGHGAARISYREKWYQDLNVLDKNVRQERKARRRAYQQLLNPDNLDNRAGAFAIQDRRVALSGCGIRDLFKEIIVDGRIYSRLELAIKAVSENTSIKSAQGKMIKIIMSLEEAERIVLNAFVDGNYGDTYKTIRNAGAQGTEVRALASDLRTITNEMVRQNKGGAHNLFIKENGSRYANLKLEYVKARNRAVWQILGKAWGLFKKRNSPAQEARTGTGTTPAEQPTRLLAAPVPAEEQSTPRSRPGGTSPVQPESPIKWGPGTMFNGHVEWSYSTKLSAAGLGGGIGALNLENMPHITTYTGPIPAEPVGGMLSSQRSTQTLNAASRLNVTFLPTLDAVPYKPISASTIADGYKPVASKPIEQAPAKAQSSRLFTGAFGYGGGALMGVAMYGVSNLWTKEKWDWNHAGFAAGTGLAFPAVEQLGRMKAASQFAGNLGAIRMTGALGAAIDLGTTLYANSDNFYSDNSFTSGRAYYDSIMAGAIGFTSTAAGVFVGGGITLGTGFLAAPVGLGAGIATTIGANYALKAGSAALGDVIFNKEKEANENRAIAFKNMAKATEINAMKGLADVRRSYKKGINEIISETNKDAKAKRDQIKKIEPYLNNASDKIRGKIIQIGYPANESVALLQEMMGFRNINGILDKALLASLSKFFGRNITQVTSGTFVEIKNIMSSRATQLEKRNAEIISAKKLSRNYRSLKDISENPKGIYSEKQCDFTPIDNVSIKDLRRFTTMSREIISILEKNHLLDETLEFCGSLAQRKNFKSIYALMNSLSDKMWTDVMQLAMGKLLQRNGYQITTINAEIVRGLLYRNTAVSFRTGSFRAI